MLVLVLGFGSCKSHRELTNADDKQVQLNVRQILQHVIEANYTFEGMQASRMSCDVELNGKNVSFKGVMRAKNNEFIDLTASKIIPIARANLRPDAVQIISYLQKGYYEGDYELVAEKFGLLVDYPFVQSILTGSFSELHDKRIRPASVDVYVENQRYVLKWKQAKVFGKGQLFTQYAYVNPTSYQVEKLRLVSMMGGDTELVVGYSNHLNLEGQQVPTVMDVDARSGSVRVKAKLQLGKVELKDEVDNNFAITDRYQKLN